MKLASVLNLVSSFGTIFKEVKQSSSSHFLTKVAHGKFGVLQAFPESFS